MHHSGVVQKSVSHGLFPGRVRLIFGFRLQSHIFFIEIVVILIKSTNFAAMADETDYIHLFKMSVKEYLSRSLDCKE